MKILVYCQHVLGIGHLFRTLEIVRAMKGHEVTLVLGGPPASLSLPEHVRVVRLPALRMDENFSGLFPVNPDHSLEEVKTERTAMLCSLAKEMNPDVIMIELFPFGRNGFSFELLPLLRAVRSGELPPAKVVCSLRDILVEKEDQAKFEQRAIERINSLFDALLVHGDPKVIPLDETFSRVNDITIPVVYTGYISETSSPEDVGNLREQIRLQPEEKLIVVSAGGGNVGFRLLETALKAYDLLEYPVRMQVFTGPYLTVEDFSALKGKSVPGVRVDRFAGNFPAWLAAADLSISMGGYNTTMNVLAAGTSALILPFSQNREQRLRIERLAPISNITMLEAEKLSRGYLADSISSSIRKQKQVPAIQLEGAAGTNQWLSEEIASGNRS